LPPNHRDSHFRSREDHDTQLLITEFLNGLHETPMSSIIVIYRPKKPGGIFQHLCSKV
jgi:hypothetical protein